MFLVKFNHKLKHLFVVIESISGFNSFFRCQRHFKMSRLRRLTRCNPDFPGKIIFGLFGQTKKICDSHLYKVIRLKNFHALPACYQINTVKELGSLSNAPSTKLWTHSPSCSFNLYLVERYIMEVEFRFKPTVVLFQQNFFYPVWCNAL